MAQKHIRKTLEWNGNPCGEIPLTKAKKYPLTIEETIIIDYTYLLIG